MARKKTAPLNKTVLYKDGKRNVEAAKSLSASRLSQNASSLSETNRSTRYSERMERTNNASTSHEKSRRKSTPRKHLTYLRMRNVETGVIETVRSTTLRQIKYLQRITTKLIPKLPFSRLIRELLMERGRLGGVERITASALEALQEAAEMYITHLFSDSNLLANHAKRKTVTPRDMALVLALRESAK